MAGTYNFGMLTAGLPDLAQRQVSTAIKGDGDYRNDQTSWLADWQKRFNTAPSPFVQTSGGWDNATATWSAPTGYYDDGPRKALEAEKAKQLAQFQADAAGRVQNQQTQQAAYNQSNGGNFLGGILNASYAQPSGGAPATSTPGSVSLSGGTLTDPAQPWGSPSYGGPMGSPSQGGFGAPSWGASQPSGWGGPFTNKNPWAAS